MPAPGEANVYAKPLTPEELKIQNDAGNDFFLVGGAETFGKVVDIYVSVSNESLSIIEDHPAWEQSVPFSVLSVSNIDDPNPAQSPPVASSHGGKIRVKGQSSNTRTVCIGQKKFRSASNSPRPFWESRRCF